MKKLLFRTALGISLGFNVYFIYNYYRAFQLAKVLTESMQGKYSSLEDGSAYLLGRIAREQPQLLSKKYYFISIWNMACGPCIREMPTLDSLAALIARKDIGYIHLSENGEQLVQGFLTRKKILSKHFVYMNDGNDYIMALLRSQGIRHKSYPLQVITDNKGTLHYFGGAYIQEASDTTLTSVIHALP